jgi:hypothetical protein
LRSINARSTVPADRRTARSPAFDSKPPEVFVDPNALAGMVFTLVLASLVGGFILLLPLSRRLGLLLEEKARQQKGGLSLPAQDVQALRDRLEALEADVRVAVERQQFIEELIVRREPGQLGNPRSEKEG